MTVTVKEPARSTPSTPSPAASGDVSQVFVLLAGLAFALLLVLIVRTAWVGDEAFVTLRSARNLVEGRGLTFNPGERVWAFSPPWALLLAGAYAVTREGFFTAIATSFLLSAAAAWLVVFRGARTRAGSVLAACALLSSAAFLEYSTSGLEGPLTHVLLAAFLYVFFEEAPAADDARATRRRLGLLALLAAFGLWSSLETARLFAPPLVLAAGEARRVLPARKVASTLLVAFSPLLAWELFAVVYYGFPLPTPFYASWNAGASAVSSVVQGGFYLLSSLSRDPATLLVLGGGLAAPWLARDRRAALVSVGIAWTLVHVVASGGDAAAGRVLAAPVVVAAFVLVRTIRLPSTFVSLAPSALVLLLASLVGRLALGPEALDPTSEASAVVATLNLPEKLVDRRGVADARLAVAGTSALLAADRQGLVPSTPGALAGRGAAGRDDVSVREDVGMYGFFAGSPLHVVDSRGNTDPLLARLPATWAPTAPVGQHLRQVPVGYEATRHGGGAALADRPLDELRQSLDLITRGPLFAPGRFAAIWAVNRGRLDARIDRAAYAYPQTVWVSAAEMATPRAEGAPAEGPEVRVLDESGGALVVKLDGESQGEAFEISVDATDEYAVTLLKDGVETGTLVVPWRRLAKGGLVVQRVRLPRELARAGYDALRITARRGDGRYAVGHLRLLP